MNSQMIEYQSIKRLIIFECHITRKVFCINALRFSLCPKKDKD